MTRLAAPAALAALAVLTSTLPVGAQEAAGTLRTFGDWIVGCDNRLACTAVGMVADLDPDIAYVKVTREAGAEAGPIVSITALAEGGAAEAGPIALSLDDGRALPVDRLEGTASGSYLAAELGPVDHTAFLKALLPAATLSVSHGGPEPASVSLKGMSAALRYMDAAQGRDGGGTAIVATGEAPADGVPPAPAAGPVDAVRLSELDPVPELPTGIAPTSPDCSEFATPVAYEAEGGARIFGTCEFTGAYNAAYRYWLADGGEAEPLAFSLPGALKNAEPSGLVNATLTADGLKLSAFNKGRGLGDCGTLSDWSFDGAAFRPVLYAEMTECRGVSPDDWPVLFTAPID